MVLTSQQASESLGEVAAAQRKARQLQGYSKAAPHLFLWGLIWLVGYAGTEFVPGMPACCGWCSMSSASSEAS